MKGIIKRTEFIIFCFLIALTSATPILAETNCTENSGLRKGYFCTNLTATKKWWASNATYTCSEGTRHKYYCIEEYIPQNYNYYFNSGIINEVWDRDRVIQKCKDRAGSVMESICRDSNINWRP